MAIPQKGSRRIVVDGVAYRWTIRRKPTYNQLLGSRMTFAVQLDNEKLASTLVVNTPYQRPDSAIAKQKAVIMPRDVTAAIRAALLEGWEPEVDAGTFEFTFDVGKKLT